MCVLYTVLSVHERIRTMNIENDVRSSFRFGPISDTSSAKSHQASREACPAFVEFIVPKTLAH